MDKNFFKFDIDDEIFKQTIKSENETKKPQTESRILKKSYENKEFMLFRGSKKSQAVNKNFDKQIGLEEQRKINPNLFKVDDYYNFDFKQKFKKETELDAELLKERLKKDINNMAELMHDKDVERVVEKAHIGVIFY